MNLPRQIDDASQFIKNKSKTAPRAGIILGTGLGRLTESIDIEAEISYEDIPHFVNATVEHHAGKLISGKIAGTPVVCMQGRFHFYEGYSLKEITFPVRVMKALGIKNLLISNIAGALNQNFQLGDMMLINDHINLLSDSPLRGENHDELGPRWPDMIEPYNQELAMLARQAAQKQDLHLQEGVYACMGGPQLETRAEYKMLQILGADAIGMSTVPEVITAVHAGLQVMAVSILTDLCYPDALAPVNIEKIIQVANEAEPRLVNLFKDIIVTL